VNFGKMQQAVSDLAAMKIRLQGNGDYEGTAAMIEKYGLLSPDLQKDLQKVNSKDIPVDIVFKQGPDVLGL